MIYENMMCFIYIERLVKKPVYIEIQYSVEINMYFFKYLNII